MVEAYPLSWPEGSFATTPTVANLAASLKEMLEVYWGPGDGDEPPAFIRQAQILVENHYRSAQG